MIVILLVTHGQLGAALLNSAELIIGKQENVRTLGLNHGDNVEDLSQEVSKILGECSGAQGVLVLTDLFGGSPSNIAAACKDKFAFKCVTGVNLPMLIETAMLRSENDPGLEDLAKAGIRAGMDGIKDLDDILKGGRG